MVQGSNQAERLALPASVASRYHIFVHGKYQDPLFQMYRVAAEFLAQDRSDVETTVEGYFESQYEQQLRHIVSKYGGPFKQARPSAPLIYAETDDDKVFFFLNDKRFFEWAYKRFKYEDHTNLVFYKRIGNKTYRQQKEVTGRSYFALGIAIGNEPSETVHFELFDEECPNLCSNFLSLLGHPKFNGHPVHRVKAGAWIQAGDLTDGSGLNSEAFGGGLLGHESFNVPHDRAGLLGMANHGRDTNGSQFYITLRDLPFMDGKSVILGRIISGMRTILKVSKTATRNERPVTDVKITCIDEFKAPGRLQQELAGR
jgi:cyclophilin family peptidyl-prolyl cis-trans isomerase